MSDNKEDFDGLKRDDSQIKRRARDNQRIKTRVQRNAGRKRTGSAASDEASSLLGTTDKRKKIQMSNVQALKILGLTVGKYGYPLPITINQARDELLSKHSPDVGGNPRRYEEISVAARHLTKYQERLFKQYKEDLKEAYKNYQSAVGPTANDLKAREKRQHDVMRGETMDAIGKELYDLCDNYLNDLMQPSYGDPRHSLKRTHASTYNECLRAIPDSEPNKQLIALQNTYYKVQNDIMKKCNDLPLEEQKLVRTAARTAEKPIDVDPNEVFKHLPPDLQNQAKEEVIAEDPIDAFQAQHQEYLSDLLAMQAEYTHHQDDFEALHDTLESLGHDYIADMKKSGANLEELSKKYAEDFQAATTKAKTAFAQEPGIWANLSECLKSICTALFFIKYLIGLSETEVDRNRMYQPEKFSIQERWDTWQMDCMPTLDHARHPNMDK